MHLMDFTYYIDDCYVEVFAGKLNKDVSVIGDENDLYWSDINCDFFDLSKYAGEGNIGHIIEHIIMSKDQYSCSTYRKAQGNCTARYIKEDTLTEIVLTDLRKPLIS